MTVLGRERHRIKFVESLSEIFPVTNPIFNRLFRCCSTIPIVSPRIFTFSERIFSRFAAGEHRINVESVSEFFPVPNQIFELVSLVAARVFSFDLNEKR